MLSKRENIFFKDFLNLLLYVYLIALTLGFIFFGRNPLFDGNTELLGLCLGLVFLMSLNYCKESQFAHVAMVTVLFLLYMFPRILTYLLAPKIVAFPFGQNVGTDAINQGLSYILIGAVLLFAGSFAAGSVFQPQRTAMPETSERPLDYPAVVFLIVLLLVLAVEFYISVWVGISPYGKLRAETGNTMLQFMRLFTAIDTFFLVVAAICLLQKEVTMDKMVVTIIVGSVFFIVTAINGGRSAGLRILMVLLAIRLAGAENFRFPLRKSAVFVGVVLGISVLAYPYATKRRVHIAYEENQSRQVPVSSLKVDPDEGKSAPASGTEESNIIMRSANLVTTLLNRLGLMDYGILVVAKPGDLRAKDKYMNLMYAVKSILNTVPGTIFKEAELNTSRVINIIYRGGDEEQAKVAYFAEFWTIWGLWFVVFGWWGGLVALFATGFVMEMIYSVGAEFFGVYKTYFRAWTLCILIPVVYFSMGIDHSFITVVVLGIQAVSMVVMLSVVNRVYAKISGMSLGSA